MECVQRPVATTVSAFLVVLYGIATLEPARAQSYPHVDSQSFNARSFLLHSTRWKCTPSVAAVDGMLTVSSVNILYENCIFSLLPSQITTVKCNDYKFNNRFYMC